MDPCLVESEYQRPATVVDGQRSGNVHIGEGRLRVAASAAGSTVVQAAARSPMRLFVQRKKTAVPHVYTSSYGGGLLAGDQTDLHVRLEPGSRCILSSQASTKIYKNPRGLPCSQSLHASVAADAILVSAPEPICCFAGSRYDQFQRFDLASGGHLVLVDWVTSGRYAIGERFQFTHYESRQRIFYDNRLVVEDAVRLCPAEGSPQSKFRMGRFNCVALMVILGDRFRDLQQSLLDQERQQTLQRGGDVLTVALPVSHEVPGVLVRVVSVEVQDARRHFEGILRHVDTIVGARTWAGKL